MNTIIHGVIIVGAVADPGKSWEEKYFEGKLNFFKKKL